MLYYFAYGSNLHPVRLTERVPSARLVGISELGSHCLAFHKRGRDGSSKCTLRPTGSASDAVFGAIYTMAREHKDILDRIEGIGCGYQDNLITLRHQEQDYDCFTYLAQQSHIADNLKPYHWYKELVLLGAEYLQFPDAYISAIKRVASVEDPEEKRRQENDLLLRKARDFP